MRCCVSIACVLSVLVVFSHAAPSPQGGLSVGLQAGVSTGSSNSGGGGGGGLTNILQNIDLPGLLRGVNSFVGLVRQFCPPLSQILDNVIQNVTSTAFRVFGRAILQNGGLGGGGGGGGQRVNVVLPTFPPDEDDYDDEDESNVATNNVDSKVTPNATTLSADSPAAATDGGSSAVNSTSTLFTSAVKDSDNTISKRHARVAREAEEASDDQDVAASAPHPAEELANIDADDADRNKRFLPFGGSVDAHGQTSGGGSGNFLFDIIRLVAGSGTSEESDEKENAPGGVAEIDIGKGADGYTEGIPGPITRLFVLANRGIANLVQDLILRLAQTSERLVNFKARLVTALI